jgi:hypothetical protein
LLYAAPGTGEKVVDAAAELLEELAKIMVGLAKPRPTLQN